MMIFSLISCSFLSDSFIIIVPVQGPGNIIKLLSAYFRYMDRDSNILPLPRSDLLLNIQYNSIYELPQRSGVALTLRP